MGTIYVQTTGSATNSGCTDQNSANLSGSAATVSSSTVTLDGSPDLSGLVTSGATQSSIYLANATNSNQKIFWITAFDNGAKTVTVSVAPTGTFTGTSNWAIGGRFVWTPSSIEAALRAGDTVTINDDIASSSSTIITARANGDTTSGPITIIGKSGTRPKLTCSSTPRVIDGNNTQTDWRIENLELIQQGASGSAIGAFSNGWSIINVKISDAGGDGVASSASGLLLIGCEITGVGAIGVSGWQNGVMLGNYIHDNTSDGVTCSTAGGNATIVYNIFDTNGGRNIYLSGAATSRGHTFSIFNNVIYAGGNTGLEVTDADTRVGLYNNIFQDNGNAAGEYNVEWVAGSAEFSSAHGYNTFYLSSGTTNVSGLTINATETTGSPAFTNAAGANFTISTTGGAFQTGYPGLFLGGSLFTGYLSMGAVIPIATGGGSTTISGGGALIGAGRIVVS